MADSGFSFHPRRPARAEGSPESGDDLIRFAKRAGSVFLGLGWISAVAFGIAVNAFALLLVGALLSFSADLATGRLDSGGSD